MFRKGRQKCLSRNVPPRPSPFCWAPIMIIDRFKCTGMNVLLAILTILGFYYKGMNERSMNGRRKGQINSISLFLNPSFEFHGIVSEVSGFVKVLWETLGNPHFNEVSPDYLRLKILAHDVGEIEYCTLDTFSIKEWE